MAQTLRMIVEYDGTPFNGWQQQQHLPSVQQTLAKALQRLTGEADVRLICAGRTDAGVHAYAQVVSFVSQSSLEAKRFTPGLNRFLPDSVRIHGCEPVPETFNARFAAHSKRYRYRIYNGPHRVALDRWRAWHVRGELDLEAMARAGELLIGEHDFNAFRSAHCEAAHARRRMVEISLAHSPRPPVGQFVDLTFHANAFCRHMCRILAGTLVEVGQGRRPAASMPQILASRQRQAAGVTAPAWGLTLVEVLYKGDRSPS
jgi:tRNA pseudouridine38-40 synthase